MTSPRDYVQPEVSDARVDRLWRGVEERLEKPSARGFRWALWSTALAGALAGAVLLGSGAWPQHDAVRAQAALTEAKLESGAQALAVTLADGSSLKLAARTAVQVRGGGSASVSLALGRGQINCDVSHQPGRKFSVTAGDVEVRVVGTAFSVQLTEGASPDVVVSVLRGVVEVATRARPGVVSRVAAGQSWSERAARDVADAVRSLSSHPGEPSPAPGQEPVPAGSVGKVDAPSVGAAASGSAAVAVGQSARELFEKAGERRRAGDAAAAAQAYEQLLLLHPNDGRAGLSAFELGRLRMDRLGNPGGAIGALERALALNVGPSFREDALARLVSIYASQGNFGACGRARDRYLSSYPAGVHAAAVTTRCGAR